MGTEPRLIRFGSLSLSVARDDDRRLREWREVQGDRLERKAPRRFDDVELVRALLDDLTDAVVGVPVRINGRPATSPAQFHEAIAQSLTGSKRERGRLQISARSSDDAWGAMDFELLITSSRRERTRVTAAMAPMREHVARLVDEHTVPYTRADRRRQAPVVSPDNAVEAYRAAFQSEIARRARAVSIVGASVSALLGFLGGLLGGLVSRG